MTEKESKDWYVIQDHDGDGYYMTTVANSKDNVIHGPINQQEAERLLCQEINKSE